MRKIAILSPVLLLVCICLCVQLAGSRDLVVHASKSTNLIDQSVQQHTTLPRQALVEALAALGGETSWSAIHSAAMRYQVLSPVNNSSAKIILFEDWSDGTARTKLNVYNREKSSESSDTSNQNKHNIRFNDMLLVLAGHLPAAAIEMMLKDTTFDFRYLDSSITEEGDIHIMALRRTANGGLIPVMVWSLSRTTLLPQNVRILPPGHSRTALGTLREYKFVSYNNSDGLLLPNVIEISTSPSERRKFLLVRYGWNPSQTDVDSISKDDK